MTVSSKTDRRRRGGGRSRQMAGDDALDPLILPPRPAFGRMLSHAPAAA